jgi:hypothetical protein
MGPSRRIATACALAVALAACTAAAAFGSAGIRVATGPANETITSSAVSFIAGGVTVRCPLTLSGIIDEATKKVEQRLMGEITRVTPGTCIGGEIRFLVETLPWMTRYLSFQGTLPNITGSTLDIKEIATLATVTVLGITVRCLYKGTPHGIVNGPEVTQLRFEEGTGIPLSVTLSGPCPERATMSGVGTLSPTLRMSLLEAEGGTIRYTAPSFPITAPGARSTANLNIANETSYPLRVARVQLAGANPERFSVSTSGIQIRGLSTSNLPVTFQPSAAGTYNATVQFLDLNGGIIASINITGTSQ